ncbi:MAG: GxxExxY protein [Candidatus Harrisonbacteria bacterium]|nr:GxxExxY protein [Candidatus Harrisonbacteria bacterium]
MAEGQNEIIYKTLSFDIIGAAFKVSNTLGWGLAERSYQRALAEELNLRNIKFRREVYIPLRYESVNIGRYFADFVVEDKILLELKVVSQLGYVHLRQLFQYLRSAGIRLGILVYFTKEGVKYRRVVNPEI